MEMIFILINKIICWFRKIWYWIYEYPRLRIERYIHRNSYSNKKPLITVYTPTYNRAGLLVERAITSVLSQSYENFEYLIIGDGCTDTTKETVESINDKRIKFYNIKRKHRKHRSWFTTGMFAANYALKKTKGKYIARIDDDDIWDSHFLKYMINYIKNNDCEFISCMNEEERYNKREINNGVPISLYLKKGSKNNDSFLGPHSSFFYKSYLRFMKHNKSCWRKKWNKVDDTDLIERMYNIGVRFGFLYDCLVYVLPRPGNKTIGQEAYIHEK